MRCVILAAVAVAVVCVQGVVGQQLFYWEQQQQPVPDYGYGDVITSWDPGVQQSQRLPRLAISEDFEAAASSASNDFVKSPAADLANGRRRARQRYNGVNQGSALKRAEQPQQDEAGPANGLAAAESEKAAAPKRTRSRGGSRAESPTSSPQLAQQTEETTTAKYRARNYRGKTSFSTPEAPGLKRGGSYKSTESSTEEPVVKRRPLEGRRKPYGGDSQRKERPAEKEEKPNSEKPATEKPVKRPFLPTTAARRRKPGDGVKYSTPPPKASEEDISDSDNYPEEFKQKLKSGVLPKEQETPFIVTPSKVFPEKSATSSTTTTTTTTTTTAKPNTLPTEDKFIEEENQLQSTKGRRPHRPTTPAGRRRSPALATTTKAPSEEIEVVKSVVTDKLRKPPRSRPALQTASLINESLRDVKDAEASSTSEAPRPVYSRPNRPKPAIVSDEDNSSPLKFSSKYRGDLKSIVSSTPVYVPTVPSVSFSLSTAPKAEPLTSTTSKIEDDPFPDFGFDTTNEPSSKGTTERATFIYKVPRNKGTTPLVASTDAPLIRSTTEEFKWKPIEEEITTEKVEIVNAETSGPGDLLSALLDAQKSSPTTSTTTSTTTTTTTTTTSTTTRRPTTTTSTTEFEGLDLASLFKSTTKAPNNSGRKVPNDVVPIISDNSQGSQTTRRPSRRPSTTTTTTTTTTTAAPTTKKANLWVVPKETGESTSASNNKDETSKDTPIAALGGITANDLLLLELLSKRGGETAKGEKAAGVKTTEKPKIDFAGLNLAKLLAAGEKEEPVELDASPFEAVSTTRRPYRVVPTNPPQAYAPPAPASSGAWNAVQGSGSTLFQLLKVIGGASLGPSNAAAPAEPADVYLETEVTTPKPRGRQQYRQPARRPGLRTTTTEDFLAAEEVPEPFDPQPPPQSALVTVAINVTKTVASLMARVVSGAARTIGAAVRGASTAIQEQWQQQQR